MPRGPGAGTAMSYVNTIRTIILEGNAGLASVPRRLRKVIK